MRANGVPIVELLITHGNASLTAQSMDGTMPLHAAVAGDHAATVEVLLRLGAPAGATLSEPAPKSTSLHLCASLGTVKAAKVLLDHYSAGGLSIDAKDESKRTALHVAAVTNRAKVAAMLLAHGAKTEKRNADGRTPLIVAANKHHVAVVEALIDGGAKLSATSAGPPVDAYRGSMEGELSQMAPLHFALLDGRGAEDSDNEAYHAAATATAEVLLREGADPWQKSGMLTPEMGASGEGMPIELALQNKNVPAFELLCKEMPSTCDSMKQTVSYMLAYDADVAYDADEEDDDMDEGAPAAAQLLQIHERKKKEKKKKKKKKKGKEEL